MSPSWSSGQQHHSIPCSSENSQLPRLSFLSRILPKVSGALSLRDEAALKGFVGYVRFRMDSGLSFDNPLEMSRDECYKHIEWHHRGSSKHWDGGVGSFFIFVAKIPLVCLCSKKKWLKIMLDVFSLVSRGCFVLYNPVIVSVQHVSIVYFRTGLIY